MLLTGECNIWVNRDLPSSEQANPLMLGRYGLGEMVVTISEGADFGELALIRDDKRSASIMCKTIVVCTMH